MIVKMKKITLLLSAKHRESTLEKLRKLGVIHIHDIKTPVSADIQTLETKIENTGKALQVISSNNETNSKKVGNEEIATVVDQVLTRTQERESLTRELEEYQEIQRWYERWGTISHSSLQQLKEAGLFIRLYAANKAVLKQIPAEKIIHIASEDQNTIYFALFTENSDDKLDLKEEQVPQVELSDVNMKIALIEKDIEKISNSLVELSAYHDKIQLYRNDLEKQLELNLVKYGMGEDGEIAYLQGFCPADSIDVIKKLSEKNGLGYLIQDPDDPTEVPTVIRNPKPIRIIQPLFKFMGTLPGYDEQDVSSVFLGFFTIFYALIVGDAGYGLIFLLLTYLLSKKKKNVPREFVRLMYLLSTATIVWGVVSGSWFGAEKIAQLPLFKMFVIGKLDSFAEGSQRFVMQLTFLIGAIHLTIAHLMSGLQKIKTPHAIADIGWIAVVWAMLFVANNLVLGKPMQKMTLPLLLAGIVLILVFANFQKNIFKGMLGIIFNLPFSVIGSFSDIVSYIRLFAVGFATVIVASNFNNIIVGSGVNSIISGIFVALILFLAHALNLVLCAMSVLVHGIRLNMLEFSGHIGVQWTGKPYQPFKE